MDSRLYDVLAAFDVAPMFDVVCLSFECGYQKPDARSSRRLSRVPAPRQRALCTWATA